MADQILGLGITLDIGGKLKDEGPARRKTCAATTGSFMGNCFKPSQTQAALDLDDEPVKHSHEYPQGIAAGSITSSSTGNCHNPSLAPPVLNLDDEL